MYWRLSTDMRYCIIMWPSLPRGRIKCCTPSVCPSICRVSPFFLENNKAVETYKLVKTQHWTRVTSGANLISKGQCQDHWKRKSKKIVFRARLRQKWIDLHQTKPKMVNGPF